MVYGDGGGKVPGAWRQPIRGRERVAGLLLGMAETARVKGWRIDPVAVNGQPGARVLARDGRLVSVLSLDLADGVVQTVRSIVNPDKLSHLGPLAERAEIAGAASRDGP